jgi:DNA-binding response OmpR family regulator
VSTAKKRILVVEDNPDLSHMMEMAFRVASFEAEFAADGREAVQKVERAFSAGKGYDFYLVDIQLPFMNGYVVASKIYELDEDAYVVLNTAYDEQDAIPRTRSMRVAEIWLKPFSLDRLRKRIGCLLLD